MSPKIIRRMSRAISTALYLPPEGYQLGNRCSTGCHVAWPARSPVRD